MNILRKLAFACCFIAGATFANTLPDIGSSANTSLSAAQERAIGQRQLYFLRQHATIIDDPEIQEYLENIGYRLVGASDNPLAQYRFFLAQSPIVNAFAAPGGFIGVNTGLITATRNESELAGVLAHEISHANQRHIARFYESQKGSGWKQAGLILAAVLLGGENPQLANAAIHTSIASSAQSQINYTREFEYEADRLAVAVLHRADFNPNGMASFFEYLANTQKFTFQVPEYLRTHPLDTNRISEARTRARQFKQSNSKESIRYYLARERIRVFSAPIEKLHSLYKDQDTSFYAKYRSALTAIRLDKNNEAIDQLEQLLEQHGEYIPYYTALGEAYLASNRNTKALAIYQEGYDLFPGNYPLTVGLAKAHSALGQYSKGIQLLNDLAYKRNDDPFIFKTLAEAYARDQQMARSHHTQAHYHLRMGQPKQAVIMLENAKKLIKNDKLLSAEIETQLKNIKETTSND